MTLLACHCLLVTTLSACEWGNTCTVEARPSVETTIVLSPPPTDPVAPLVRYSVDGAAPETCEGGPVEFICGWEIPGQFLVVAQAPGYFDASQAVTVTETDDGCHVETVSLTLTLTALPRP